MERQEKSKYYEERKLKERGKIETHEKLRERDHVENKEQNFTKRSGEVPQKSIEKKEEVNPGEKKKCGNGKPGVKGVKPG